MKSNRKKKEPRKAVKWKDENFVSIYEFAKQGMKLAQIASAIGVSLQTLKEWYNDIPAVSDAIKRGRASNQGTTGTITFLDYVYKRLPSELQDVWMQLKSSWSKEENGEKRVERILQGCGTRERQTLFVHSLIASNFNASEACRKINLPYTTLNAWKERDPDFVALMDTIHEMKKDFCEGALMGLVSAGDTSAVLFVNRTLNRDRGYDPKVTVEHRGSINHQVDLTSLNLPPEVLRVIADAARKKREELEGGPTRILELPAKVVSEEEDFSIEELEEVK